MKIYILSFENEEELYKKALERRDEVSLYRNISIDANEKNIDIEKSSYYPQVFTHLEYGVNDE